MLPAAARRTCHQPNARNAAPVAATARCPTNQRGVSSRRLVSAAFTPRVVAGLKPHIDEIIDELLGRVAGTGRLEVIGDLAYPLPVRVISELLGGSTADVNAARDEFVEYFRELIAVRRAEPHADLLSHLIRVEQDGDQLTEDELVTTCVLLLVAGHETTVNLIGNGILALLRHPEQLAALRADPALAGAVVEETLRYDPPVQMSWRVARSGVRVGEIEPPEGGIILILLAAASRDPEVFAEPDRFDIARRDAHGHLAFGAGPHFCLGASLARLEAASAFAAFATRVDNPRLEAESLEYKPNLNLRGPAQMVVQFS